MDKPVGFGIGSDRCVVNGVVDTRDPVENVGRRDERALVSKPDSLGSFLLTRPYAFVYNVVDRAFSVFFFVLSMPGANFLSIS